MNLPCVSRLLNIIIMSLLMCYNSFCFTLKQFSDCFSSLNKKGDNFVRLNESKKKKKSSQGSKHSSLCATDEPHGRLKRITTEQNEELLNTDTLNPWKLEIFHFFSSRKETLDFGSFVRILAHFLPADSNRTRAGAQQEPANSTTGKLRCQSSSVCSASYFSHQLVTIL